MIRLLVTAGCLFATPLMAQAQDTVFVPLPCDTAQTTAAMRWCYGAAGRQADTAMAAVLRETRRRALDRIALDSAQARWLDFRDAQCRAEGTQFEGGSLKPVVVLACRLHLTERRIAYLRRLFEDL